MNKTKDRNEFDDDFTGDGVTGNTVKDAISCDLGEETFQVSESWEMKLLRRMECDHDNLCVDKTSC